MKTLSILGSTGSIGTQALSIVRAMPTQFCVVALGVQKNIEILHSQIQEFSPQYVAVYDEKQAALLRDKIDIPVLSGAEGLCTIASLPSLDLVIAAIAGTKGIASTLAAIDAGIDVALANKETLVSAGALAMQKVREKNTRILPIDSEHSAIFQCLQGETHTSIQRLILTASGGPFRNHSYQELQNISVSHALRHPNWTMGPKVTIDCSTLMNKGLEVIEAHWLFNVPLDKIEIVIHPESVIHSLVEFVDGSIKAQMGEPTMVIPIQYAMTFPERIPGTSPPFDFWKREALHFGQPDTQKFRCLALAYQAQREGKSYPPFLNAANEELVRRLLENEIRWVDVGEKLEWLLERHTPHEIPSLEAILAADEEGRRAAQQV